MMLAGEGRAFEAAGLECGHDLIRVESGGIIELHAYRNALRNTAELLGTAVLALSLPSNSSDTQPR